MTEHQTTVLLMGLLGIFSVCAGMLAYAVAVRIMRK